MSGFTKVIIYGNLTKKPEKHLTPAGTAITQFSVAVSRSFKKPDGSTKDEATFVDVRAFGKQAEQISNTFNKGNPIFLEGHLKLDHWESKEGSRRSKLSVVLDTFHYTEKKSVDADVKGATDINQEPAKHNSPSFKEAVVA